MDLVPVFALNGRAYSASRYDSQLPIPAPFKSYARTVCWTLDQFSGG